MQQQRVEKFDMATFRAFRATKDERKRRALLERLVMQNTPLAKIIVEQLCGLGITKRRGYRALGGCQGFRDLPWDDAMQAGLIALQKAIEQFDPEKGKFSPYVKLKARHELQDVIGRRSLIRVPRGREDEAVPLRLVGDQRILDALSTGSEWADVIESGVVTSEEIARWSATGDWPEDLEEVQRRRREEAENQERLRPAIDRFIETRLVFRPAGRLLRSALLGRWRSFALAEGATPSERVVVDAVMARGATVVRGRASWSSSCTTFARVSLVAA